MASESILSACSPSHRSSSSPLCILFCIMLASSVLTTSVVHCGFVGTRRATVIGGGGGLVAGSKRRNQLFQGWLETNSRYATTDAATTSTSLRSSLRTTPSNNKSKNVNTMGGLRRLPVVKSPTEIMNRAKRSFRDVDANKYVFLCCVYFHPVYNFLSLVCIYI